MQRSYGFSFLVAFLCLLMLGAAAVPAQVPPSTPIHGSPEATPAASRMPAGALGAQMLWIEAALNQPGTQGARADFILHLSPALLDDVSLDDIQADFVSLRARLGVVTIADVTVPPFDSPVPPTASYSLNGTSGKSVRLQVSVDLTSRQIDRLSFSPLYAFPATPVASPSPGVVLPEGALGQQVTWLLSVLKGVSSLPLDEEIARHVTERFPQDGALSGARAGLVDMLTAAPLGIKDNEIGVTIDVPPTTASMMLVGRDGSMFRMVVTVSNDDGRIDALVIVRMDGDEG